jgi:hypothetical protein
MSSTLDPDSFSENGKPVVKGHDIRSLGPSDSSDTGSDVAGPGVEGEDADSDTDRFGTGERAAAADDADVEIDQDIRADRVVTADKAGLGGGLDQAEEARLGITDEELAGDMSVDDVQLPTDDIADEDASGKPAGESPPKRRGRK